MIIPEPANLIISYDPPKDENVGVLGVGIFTGLRVVLINQFHGEEAARIYDLLTSKQSVTDVLKGEGTQLRGHRPMHMINDEFYLVKTHSTNIPSKGD